MTFPFDLSKVLKSNPTEKFILRLQFLKTYIDAGWIELNLCSRPISQLDTLFGHYKTAHFSKPHWFTISIDYSFFKIYCRSGAANLQVTYSDDANHSSPDARGTRRVKVYSIEMCFYNRTHKSTFSKPKNRKLNQRILH